MKKKKCQTKLFGKKREKIWGVISYATLLSKCKNEPVYCSILFLLCMFQALKKTLANMNVKNFHIHTLGCGIFGFCLLSFPQNERKIYKLRQLSLSQFVYFLRAEPSMFTFTKYFLTRGDQKPNIPHPRNLLGIEKDWLE